VEFLNVKTGGIVITVGLIKVNIAWQSLNGEQ